MEHMRVVVLTRERIKVEKEKYGEEETEGRQSNAVFWTKGVQTWQFMKVSLLQTRKLLCP